MRSKIDKVEEILFQNRGCNEKQIQLIKAEGNIFENQAQVMIMSPNFKKRFCSRSFLQRKYESAKIFTDVSEKG